MGLFGFGKKEKDKMKDGLEKTRTGFWGNILNTLTGSKIDDDRRQWRKQGVAVGAAASKTQAKRCGCWVPQPGQWHGVSRDGEVQLRLIIPTKPVPRQPVPNRV